MSASLNRVILIGNLTADPELRYTPGGTARVRFSIAVNRQYKDASGKLQEEATFVPIVVWGSQAENCANYLRKGRSIAVEGRLRIDSFQNADGEKVRITEVVASNVQFLGGPQRAADEPAGAAPEAPIATDEGQLPEEEVPF
ncbi:MAG: single-stranded DNA-binding protein [Candidatus Bipolaricaulota bacterium]|jgi:single-strand DNA-binding protein|nr:single-stranded DNA-binding protein [Candidatus Bipolaricaulota bacterium]MCX6101597.1 single-stranded DNA-binding protein [Candidatus Bipolaricaulota bacterium]